MTVINARFVKPLDTELIQAVVANHPHVVTVEENVLSGGFGSQVAQYLISNSIGFGKLSHYGIP